VPENYGHTLTLHRQIGLLLVILFFFGQVQVTQAQINVAAGQTAQVLAQKLAGQGVTLSNAVLHCPSVANGLFRVTSSNIGIDSGIVLTTGRAATQGSKYGVNGFTAFLASNNNNAPGDASLTELAGQQTLDACALEFNVIPNGDTVRFSYIFSSEEYINAVCGPYNDAFAFFISGPGIPGAQNMALVPGTNIPVTINSINNGIPGSTGDIKNCKSMGPGSPFTSYYISNNPGATLTHQGFTKVLQAIHGVTPCATYHLKLVIADAGNALYDSGVFLKAGSLQSGDYSVSALIPGTLSPANNDSGAFCVKGCQPGVFLVKRQYPGALSQTIRYTLAGDAVSGIDYVPVTGTVTIPANDTAGKVFIYGLPTAALGTKSAKIYIYSPLNCAGITGIADSATLAIYDTIHISIATSDPLICRKDSVQLTVNGYDFLTYHWTPEDGINNPSLKNPIAAPLSNTTYYVTATLPGSSCSAKAATIDFTLRPTPIIGIPADTTVCYNAAITLPATVMPDTNQFSFHWDGPTNFASSIQNPVIDSALKANMGLYSLKVTNDTNGCSDFGTMRLNINIPDTPSVANPQVFCQKGQLTQLEATGGKLRWYSTPDRSDTGGVYAPYARTDQITTYNYYVSNTIDGCASPRVKIDVEVRKCCDGNVFVPNAFTPNGLHNNRFRIVMDYGYRLNSMYIFNRWGQAVYTGLEGAWDGTFGGVPAETGTYFYKIILGCIRGGTTELTGDVLLVR
jgi:gliding motility-associated-like protein